MPADGREDLPSPDAAPGLTAEAGGGGEEQAELEQDDSRWHPGRRAAKFEEALWEVSAGEGSDDKWLAGLRQDLGDARLWGEGAGSGSARERPVPSEAKAAPSVPVQALAGLRDALDDLENRLSHLEGEVASVRSALMNSQAILDRAQMAVIDVPSERLAPEPDKPERAEGHLRGDRPAAPRAGPRAARPTLFDRVLKAVSERAQSSTGSTDRRR